jgi:YHS domain-containing protein
MKVVDPVCKMTIEDKEAAGTSSRKGTTYYFCSKPCKEDFDKNPESFVSVISPIPPLIKGGEGGIIGIHCSG